MTSVHPLAPSSSASTSASSTTKPKGIPIDVPKNERRLSNFSLKTTNRALMTGFRDGGHAAARRKSSLVSLGSKSPPFLAHKADDYDIIGALPGFEQTVDVEVNRMRIPDSRSSISIDQDDIAEPVTKKKKVDKDAESTLLLSPPLTATTPKGRRKSSVVSFGSPPHPSQQQAFSPRSPQPSVAFSPSPPPTTSGAAQSRARLLNGPATSLSSGRRDSVSSLSGASSNSSNARPWPRIQISCVRVGPKTEFATPNTTIEFASDRIALVIRGKTTTILHTELKLVEYYTASRVRIMQIVTWGKLSEKSILANYYDPTLHSGKARKIVLYTDEDGSSVLGQCSKLKEKGVETRCLTPEAAEKLLTMNHRRVSPQRLSQQSEETLFMFPFQNLGKSKSIAVRSEDVSRLADGEFLNDTLIEFGLKYIHSNLELKNASLAGQVYIFNSFFYQRLLAKPSKGSMSSYDSVKSWTSKVDLFSMKYIIVPIHENLHWYLAIIVNPGLILQEAEQSAAATSSTEEVTSLDILEHQEDVHILDPDSPSAEHRNEMDVDATDSKPASSPDFNASTRPFILCLDSLRGAHPTVFKTLRSYLQQELLTRKGVAAPLTSKELVGKYSKCPRQENLCDCGVYLLHYAEVFLRNPSAIVDSIVSKSDDPTTWAASEIPSRREKYRDVMSSLTAQYKVFKFRQEYVDNIKEHSKDRRDSQSHSASESDGGSNKSDSGKSNTTEDATDSKEDTEGNVLKDAPGSSRPPLGLAITTPGGI
ncbi:hypothetical protein EMPS_01877 [Entomortierella parvispora]|uniref:Ubiquitin-like protease family profile domain-containing protein n=1 Tax=Entomortierella parvispora TaxID=205924 RepID=A0A9P3H3N3_9FUNG|nr:hypothetical protein EMPS_01877 [Entomortierella parvispora]